MEACEIASIQITTLTTHDSWLEVTFEVKEGVIWTGSQVCTRRTFSYICNFVSDLYNLILICCHFYDGRWQMSCQFAGEVVEQNRCHHRVGAHQLHTSNYHGGYTLLMPKIPPWFSSVATIPLKQHISDALIFSPVPGTHIWNGCEGAKIRLGVCNCWLDEWTRVLGMGLLGCGPHIYWLPTEMWVSTIF